MDYQIKDSGTRATYETGAQRDAEVGKGRFDLLPYHGIQRVAVVFEKGGAKYGDGNWLKGIPTHRYMDSAMRHAMKHAAGHRDEDHAAMAAWNLLCLIETEYRISIRLLPESLSTLPKPLDLCGIPNK